MRTGDAGVVDTVGSELVLAQRLYAVGDLAGALRAYRRVLAQEPGNGAAWNGLGVLFACRHNWDAFHLCMRRACRFEASRQEALGNLARSLLERKLEDAAAVVGMRMIADRPDLPGGYMFLQSLYFKLDRLDRARKQVERALKLVPDDGLIVQALAGLLHKQGLGAAARERLREAEQLNVEPSAVFRLMAESAAQHGQVAEALKHFQKALALNPGSHSFYQSWLFHCNYLSGGPNDLLPQHRMWASMCASQVPPPKQPYAGSADPDRKLRIGFVSADFYFHSVAYFLAPLLDKMDRAQVEVVCYSDTNRPDENTTVLRGFADLWRDITTWPDAAVAEVVRADGIDILIDLGGHTNSGRPLVFAARPAPVQVTWLGYPNTTGLPAIAYRLTDAEADPPGMTERHHTEELVRLPRTFLCYRPPDSMPVPRVRATSETAPITFGSLNNLSKITPEVMALWARILKAVPESRLLLKSRAFNDPDTGDLYREHLRRGGCDPQRLELVTLLPHSEHFAVYDRIDIALDPFPYNGTTTTVEALWMGVPVVGMAGTTHRGRVGASLLRTVGLGALIADDEDGYVETAVRLASDRPALAALSNGLRARVAASPLRDEAGFCRDFEATLRDLWRRWCATQDRGSGS